MVKLDSAVFYIAYSRCKSKLIFHPERKGIELDSKGLDETANSN